MRLTTRLAAGLLAASGCLAVEAGAQGSPDIRLLGYNATLTASCNVGCTQLAISLMLDGARPTDNQGQPVPGAISALDKYLRNATFQIFGNDPTVTGISGLTGSFTSAIDNSPTNFAAVVITDPIIPLSANSVAFTLMLAPGSNVSSVSANGLAYVDPELNFLRADGTVQPVPPPLPPPPGGPFYQTGDFNAIVNVSAVPEPSSLALFGTGIVGLVAAGIRRRRQS